MSEAREEGEKEAGLHQPKCLDRSACLALHGRACTRSDGGRCARPSTIPVLLHRNQFKDLLRQDTSLINSAHCIPPSEVGSFYAILLCAG